MSSAPRIQLSDSEEQVLLALLRFLYERTYDLRPEDFESVDKQAIRKMIGIEFEEAKEFIQSELDQRETADDKKDYMRSMNRAITYASENGLTKSMAVEYGAQGLRVNAVCPGAVLTNLTRSVRMPEGADAKLLAKLMPLTAIAKPEEVAEAVAYLASDAARYITGTTLSIDGGQTAG